MKRLFIDKSVNDRRAFNQIFYAVLLTVLYQTFHTLVSPVYGIVLSIIIIGFGLRGCIIYYKNHSLKTWGIWFLILIVYFFVVGLLHGTAINHNIFGLILSQDIRFVLFFFIGGIFAFDDNMMSFHQIMRVLGAVAVFFGFLALFFYTPAVQNIDTRESTWSMSYYYWWCSSACFYYWGYYTLFEKKDKIIGYGVMFSYLILGVLFLKRSVVVDVGVMLVIYIFFGDKRKGFWKPLFLILAAVLVLLIFKGGVVNTIYNLMLGRFELAVDEFDRQIEANLYFQNASQLDLLLGNGIGHYYAGMDIRNTDGVINALHLGWANVIYKGGGFYAAYNILLYLFVLARLFNRPRDNYGKVCLGVALSSLISMFYAGSWTYTIYPFCISAPIFYIATHSTNTRYLKE